MISYLTDLYLIPDVGGQIKLRSSIMLSQIMMITAAASFRMTDADIVTQVERTAIDLLWQHQNQ